MACLVWVDLHEARGLLTPMLDSCGVSLRPVPLLLRRGVDSGVGGSVNSLKYYHGTGHKAPLRKRREGDD